MSDSSAQPVPPDDRPRFRWVVPLFIGVSIGAVVGILVTFTAFRSRSSSAMMVTSFDVRRALAGTAAEQFSVQDSSVNIGSDSYNPIDGGTSVRRRIELTGSIRDPAEAGNLASKLKSQVEAEVARHGTYTSGGGSSSSSSNREVRFTSESGFYKGSNRGQVDFIFHSNDRQVHAVILIHEGR
jgi:hypothetical protein